MIVEQPIVGVGLTDVALDVIEEVLVVGSEAVVVPQIPELSETKWFHLRASLATVSAHNILPDINNILPEIVQEATDNEIAPINLIEANQLIKIPHGLINKNFSIKFDR